MTLELTVLVAHSSYICPKCGMALAYEGLPFREMLARNELMLRHPKDYSSFKKLVCPDSGKLFRVEPNLVEAQVVPSV